MYFKPKTHHCACRLKLGSARCAGLFKCCAAPATGSWTVRDILQQRTGVTGATQGAGLARGCHLQPFAQASGHGFLWLIYPSQKVDFSLCLAIKCNTSIYSMPVSKMSLFFFCWSHIRIVLSCRTWWGNSMARELHGISVHQLLICSGWMDLGVILVTNHWKILWYGSSCIFFCSHSCSHFPSETHHFPKTHPVSEGHGVSAPSCCPLLQ